VGETDELTQNSSALSPASNVYLSNSLDRWTPEKLKVSISRRSFEKTRAVFAPRATGSPRRILEVIVAFSGTRRAILLHADDVTSRNWH
jgi:hypothetical protein